MCVWNIAEAFAMKVLTYSISCISDSLGPTSSYQHTGRHRNDLSLSAEEIETRVSCQAHN